VKSEERKYSIKMGKAAFGRLFSQFCILHFEFCIKKQPHGADELAEKRESHAKRYFAKLSLFAI